MLNVKDLAYSVDNTTILHGIDLAMSQRQFVGIIGPNGSGKSTFLKNVYRVLKPTRGTIYLNSENIVNMSNKAIAQSLAVVSQEYDYGFDFSVREIVLMGRYPLKDFYERENKQDEEIIDQALQRVGLLDLKSRNFSTLSGGEKQRVLIARAIAQESEFIIMDEPTNHLDVGYQVKVMDLMRSLDKTVLSAIHDLNMAIVYCDKIIVLHTGRIVASGDPSEILTAELISEIYDVPTHIEYNSYLNRKMIIFKSSCEV